MATRQTDNEAKWFYSAQFPGMDMRMDENATDPRLLVDAVGIDGRFEGSLRVFPGFAGSDVHGIPSPTPGVTVIEELHNIGLVKFVSIRKGTGPHTLSGLIFFADNTAGTGKAIHFAYRDSETGTSDVITLEDTRNWADFRPTTFEEYDLTYLGRYAYFVNSGNTTSLISSFQNKEVPYNKAYFWDFKVTSWDGYEGGFQQRLMGLLPQRALGTPVNELNSDDAFDLQTASEPDFDGGAFEPFLPAGDYTGAIEIISKKHNLRSFFRIASEDVRSTHGQTLRWRFTRIKPVFQTAAANQLRGPSNSSLTAAIHWGIAHADAVRLWRTPRDDSGVATVSLYVPTSRFYKIRELELGRYDAASGIQLWTVLLVENEDLSNPVLQKIGTTPDSGILAGEEYDPVYHEFGSAPRMKRLIGFDGILIGVTDAREPATVEQTWTKTERIPEAFCWSAIHLNEPENFQTLNFEELDDPSEKVLSLHAGASAAFGVSNMGIYRMVRAGTGLTITRVAYPNGGVSRFGQIAVGDTLYVVTRTGVKEIDGTTGEVRGVRLLNRLVYDDKRWADSLESVHVGYDGYAGALLFLNTTLHELVILWESTGAITRVIDCPWLHVASGPDVLTGGGSSRAYLVDSIGQVHTIDAAREAGKVTMFGADFDETVNGTITEASSTEIIDSAAAFTSKARNFNVYILSGDLEGEQATITDVPNATTLTVSGLSGPLSIGDRYSVGPIIVSVRFPRLTGMGADDPFVRKVTSSMSVSIMEPRGEVNTNDVNAFIRLGLTDGTHERASGSVRVNTRPDQMNVRTNAGATRLFPFIESKGANMDYEIDALLVRGQLTASEAESRQG
jgi:hypothetical protein